MNIKHCLLISCLTVSFIAHGQASLSPFTTNLLASQKEGHSRSEATAPISAYIHIDRTANSAVLDELEDAGCTIGCEIGQIVTAHIPGDAIDIVRNIKGVTYIQAGTPVEQMMNIARPAAGVDKAYSGEGLSSPFTGKGTIIGVIDTGFDYTHPAFLTSDGTTLRIKRVWEQGTNISALPGSTVPEKFGYGAEFDTSDEIMTACADITGNSHGTHVLGIAAGADMANGRTYWGVAPDAEIVIVSINKSDVSTVNISDAIAYIYDYAESVGKPCVINMSLGNHIGPHDGTSTFDQVADELQGEGRLLVGSVGNFGATKLHAATTAGQELSATLSYVYTPSYSTAGGNIDIWADKGTNFKIRIAVVNTATGAEVSSSETFDASIEDAQTFVLSSPNAGKIMLATETSPLNGKSHTLLTSQVTSLRDKNAVRLYITPEGEGTVNLWADGSYLTFVEGDTDMTLSEIGGTGKKIVSVGAYVVSHGKGQMFPDDEIGATVSFSSRGPSADGRTKPEILTPGSYIASAYSSYSTVPTGTLVCSFNWNGSTYSYAYMEGTSMAAPFAAGVAALWLQANPQLSPEQFREIISSTATADNKIDAYEGLKSAASVTDIELPDGQLSSVIYYDLYGRRIAAPDKGLYLKRSTYTNGSTKTEKIRF